MTKEERKTAALAAIDKWADASKVVIDAIRDFMILITESWLEK